MGILATPSGEQRQIKCLCKCFGRVAPPPVSNLPTQLKVPYALRKIEHPCNSLRDAWGAIFFLGLFQNGMGLFFWPMFRHHFAWPPTLHTRNAISTKCILYTSATRMSIAKGRGRKCPTHMDTHVHC